MNISTASLPASPPAPHVAGPALRALSSLSDDQRVFLRSLPKAELHAHLNGCIPYQTLQELAAEYLERNTDSIAGNLVQADLKRLAQLTLNDIGEFFGLFKAIYLLNSTPESISRTTEAILSTFLVPSEDGYPECSYIELRTTPRASDCMTRTQYLEAVLRAADRYQPHVGIIVSCDRGMNPEDVKECIDVAIDLRKKGRAVVAVDLCGHPLVGDVKSFEIDMGRAKDAGLGVTLHIAETMDNTSEDTKALLHLIPDRLGHATFLDAEAKQTVAARKLPIEVCLSSNLICKTAVSLDAHHIGYWLEKEHPIAICTDDTLPFATSLTAEYALLFADRPHGLGLSAEQVRRVAEMSLSARFTRRGIVRLSLE